MRIRSSHLGRIWATVSFYYKRFNQKTFSGHPKIAEILPLFDAELSYDNTIAQPGEPEDVAMGGVKVYRHKYLPTKTRWSDDKTKKKICYHFDGGGTKRKKIRQEDVNKVLMHFKNQEYETVELGGHMSLSEMVNHLSESELFVGEDSGPSHVCHSVGTPCNLLHYSPATCARFHVGVNTNKIWGSVDEFIASLSKKLCVFVHVPKCAGTSMREALAEHPEKIKITDIGKEGWHAVLEGEQVAFVRDPLTRLKSAYNFIAKMKHKGRKSRLRKLQSHINNNYRGFNDFCLRFHTDKYILKESVFRLQSEFVGDDVAFLGRFENLQQDWVRLCDFLGIEHVEMPSRKRGDYDLEYTSQSMRNVVEFYKEDFVRFGYPIPEIAKETWAFSRVPKTASSSMMGILKKYDHILTPRHPYPHRRIDCSNQFAFIREPIERFKSAYFMHFTRWFKDDKRRQLRRYIRENFSDFDDFCLRFHEHDRMVSADVFRVQSEWIDEDVKFIGRFDNLEEDWRRLCEVIGIEHEPLPHLKKSEHSEVKLTEKGLENVKRFYEQDIRLYLELANGD